MNILICIPSNRDWKATFGVCLINLISHMGKNQWPFTLNIMLNSSLLPASRQNALKAAVDGGFTHALMIDDDMRFSPEAFEYLLLAMTEEKVPFVAANYVSKGVNGKAVAKDLQGNQLRSSGKNGCEEISEIGLGFSLLDVRALDNLELPWFEVPYLDTAHLGEDYYFCRLLRHNGLKLLVEHDATKYVGHIGDHVYTERDLKEETNEQTPPRYL